MGTRRSRHNKGRKPLYKDHRLIAADLIGGRAPYFNGLLMNNRTDWSAPDIFKLQVLCEADSEYGAAEHVLARNASACYHKARDLAIMVPSDWTRKFAPSRRKIVAPASPKRPDLAYPFIQKSRPEHADLLTINGLIPKGIPDDRRADMCQEIMIAILEGRTTIDSLRAKGGNGGAAWFIRKFWKDNFEVSGHAVSFDVMDDGRDYDEIASSISAREWHHSQMNERRTYRDSLHPFTPPTQIEAVWDDDVTRAQLRLHDIGQFLSRAEVEEMLDG